jgi:hypothetical protein
MKEDLLEDVTEGQIYTTRTIVLSALFGGLPAASFMLYQNFKVFEEHKKASAIILITILTLGGITATSFIPALEKIPDIFYAILITIAVSLLTKKYQGNLINRHISTGGKIYSTGRALLICLISVLLVAALFSGVYFLQDAATGNL